jgi:hypothetical protein
LHFFSDSTRVVHSCTSGDCGQFQLPSRPARLGRLHRRHDRQTDHEHRAAGPADGARCDRGAVVKLLTVCMHLPRVTTYILLSWNDFNSLCVDLYIILSFSQSRFIPHIASFPDLVFHLPLFSLPPLFHQRGCKRTLLPSAVTRSASPCLAKAPVRCRFRRIWSRAVRSACLRAPRSNRVRVMRIERTDTICWFEWMRRGSF